MLFTPIYIAMTFIKTWRIRSFRARLLEFLSGNTSVAFCKVPENAAETPTLSSKLCTNPKNAYLCDLLDYTNASRICSMKPMQCIEISDWVSCAGGLPLGSSDTSPVTDLDVDVLFECELNPHEYSSHHDIITLESMGQPIAWKAGSHLAIIVKTNIEHLSVIGFQFVGGEFIIDRKLPVVRIQTVQLSGEPNKATDPSMRGLRSDIQQGLRQSHGNFQWPVHAALLRKLSKVVDIKSDIRSISREMNGGSDQALDAISVGKRQVTLADVSTITTKSLSADEETEPEINGHASNATELQKTPEKSLESTPKKSAESTPKKSVDGTTKKSVESTPNKSMDSTLISLESTPKSSLENTPKKSPHKSPQKKDYMGDKEMVVENVTVEIQHNITPKKSSLKLDLKKGTSQLSSSLLNISSQIKSITTHKRIVSTTGPKKTQPPIESSSQVNQESSQVKEPSSQTKEEMSQIKGESSQPKEECLAIKEEESSLAKAECSKSLPYNQGPPKSMKSSRPLVNTKSPNVLIYSDSVVARDNLEATLRKVLDCDRYAVTSVSLASLCSGAWRGRCALVAVAGCAAGAGGPLLAHLLSGGRLLALCSDLLHTVLPHYETAEIRENEIVQFSYDKWKSVKMKHHIFCYQASPAKKQFSTESDRQPSKYTGHPGHELDIQVLASEETWRTPSLLQATDLTNKGIAIFSQIHLEADPCDYLGEEGIKSNEARLEILHKILGDILGLHVKDPREFTQIQYTRGYFLGDHVHKLSLVEAWCPGREGREGRRELTLGSLRVQWCARGQPPSAPPSENFLPVSLHECPEHFNTVDYYDNLTSKSLGRVVIYADVLSSTSRVTGPGALAHGVAAVCRRQVAGRGRGGNVWISPPGQAIISLQLWQKASASLPLVQHAAALAAVRAVRSEPAYELLDIRIKWPNDVYYGRDVKIGGTISTANCTGDDVVVNVGTGVNVSNSVPTTCVNDIIAEHNRRHGTALQPFTIERYLARYCSQLERVLDYVGSEGGVHAFREQYYQYWLHDGEEIQIMNEGASSPVTGTISGIDDAGWLLVRTAAGELRVAPDGNTFDIMSGLIAPKH